MTETENTGVIGGGGFFFVCSHLWLSKFVLLNSKNILTTADLEGGVILHHLYVSLFLYILLTRGFELATGNVTYC